MAKSLDKLLGEVVGWLGDAAGLDRLDVDFVGQGLAGETLVGEVVGVLHVELLVVAGLGAAQILGELGDRVLAADFDHDFVDFDRLVLFAFLVLGRNAAEADHSEIAIGDGAVVFDSVVGGVLQAQVLQSASRRLLR